MLDIRIGKKKLIPRNQTGDKILKIKKFTNNYYKPYAKTFADIGEKEMALLDYLKKKAKEFSETNSKRLNIIPKPMGERKNENTSESKQN